MDALNEYQTLDGDREELLSNIFKLQDKNINLFSTSRPILEIEARFKDSILLEICARDEDVQKYLESHIKRLPRFVFDNPNLQRKIKATMSQTIHGI
jgi:hypothetical protein